MKKRVSVLIMGLMTAVFLLFAVLSCLPKSGVRISAGEADAAAVLRGNNEEDTEADILMPGEHININTASAEELMRLPGIGETLSERIVSRRESEGAFESIEEIMQVDGIGDARFAAIEEYITVEDTK